MIDETFIARLESGDPEAVAIASKAMFPSSLRQRAERALFVYALANPFEGQSALRRAVGLATRDSLQGAILPFLSSGPLGGLALKLLAQKGPFPTCSAPLRLAILNLVAKSKDHGELALVAAVSLGIKEAPEKIPGSLKLRRALIIAELETLVRHWSPSSDKSLYRRVVKAL